LGEQLGELYESLPESPGMALRLMPRNGQTAVGHA
jgi:hypothetical protein